MGGYPLEGIGLAGSLPKNRLPFGGIMGYSKIKKDVVVQEEYDTISCDTCGRTETSPGTRYSKGGREWRDYVHKRWAVISIYGTVHSQKQATVCSDCVNKVIEMYKMKEYNDY